MHSLSAALAAFCCSLCAASIGLLVGPHLPSSHLSVESRHVVRVCTGIVATLTGMVLALLVSTSNSVFTAADTQVKEISARLIELDHVLARYGPETAPIRAELRRYVEIKIDEVWSHGPRGHRAIETSASDILDNALDRLNALSATTPAQQRLRERALTLAGDVTQSRWLLVEGNVGSAVPAPFLGIVIFWMTVLFLSFGLFAPRNAIAIGSLVVCALSVATALFLVVELSRPFGGILEVPSAPARNALAHLAR